MKLYIHPGSPNARRARAAARLVGAAVTEVVVDLPGGAGREPAYRRIHPLGKVPALVDGDTTLWESNAIAVYLAESTGHPAWPGAPAARADVLRWMLFGQIHLDGPAGTLVGQALFTQGNPDPAVVRTASGALRPLLEVLEARLQDEVWLTGSEPTLADVAVGASFTYAGPAAFPLDDSPGVQRWLGQLAPLPWWHDTRPPGA